MLSSFFFPSSFFLFFFHRLSLTTRKKEEREGWGGGKGEEEVGRGKRMKTLWFYRDRFERTKVLVLTSTWGGCWVF